MSAWTTFTEEIHKRACAQGRYTYKDPLNGMIVFTELYHLKRGSCCESGCRHCPYRSSLEK